MQQCSWKQWIKSLRIHGKHVVTTVMSCIVRSGVSCTCLLIANNSSAWIKHNELENHVIEQADVISVCACSECNSRSLIKSKVSLVYNFLPRTSCFNYCSNFNNTSMLFICVLETIDVVFLELVNAVTDTCTCIIVFWIHKVLLRKS